MNSAPEEPAFLGPELERRAVAERRRRNKRNAQAGTVAGALALPCLEHNAVPNQPCWYLPSDDPHRKPAKAVCGQRLAQAGERTLRRRERTLLQREREARARAREARRRSDATEDARLESGSGGAREAPFWCDQAEQCSSALVTAICAGLCHSTCHRSVRNPYE